MPDAKPLVSTDGQYQHIIRSGDTLADASGNVYVIDTDLQDRIYGIAYVVDYYADLPSVWETWFSVGTLCIVRHDSPGYKNGLYRIEAVGSGREWAYFDDLNFQDASEITFDATSTILTSSNVRDAIEELANWDFVEIAQDAVGNALTDSLTISFVYDDGSPYISAFVAPNSLTDVHIASGAAIDWAKIDKSGSELTDLDDVASYQAHNEVLIWNSYTNQWEPGIISSGSIGSVDWDDVDKTGSELTDIADVTAYQADNEVLIWNAYTNEWEPGLIGSDNVTTVLWTQVDKTGSELTDLEDVAGYQVHDEVLIWNSYTNQWEPGTISGDQVTSIDWDQVDKTGSSILDIADTPSTYTGNAGKVLAVNAGEDGIEETDMPGVAGTTSTSFQLSSGGAKYFYITHTGLSGTAVIDEVLTSTYRSAEWFVTISNSTGSASFKVLAIHDDDASLTTTPSDNVDYTVYGLVQMGLSLSTTDITVSITSGNMTLYVDLGALTNITSKASSIRHLI